MGPELSCDAARRALDAGERSDALEAHLAVCADCADVQRALEAPMASPMPEGLFAALRARLPEVEADGPLDCAGAREALVRLLDDEDAAPSAGLARHLRVCGDCRAERARLAAMERGLESPVLADAPGVVRIEAAAAEDAGRVGCDDVVQALGGDGQPLSPAMAAHLADCPACLAARDRLAAVERVLDRPALDDVAIAARFVPAADAPAGTCEDVQHALAARPEAGEPLPPTYAAHLAECAACRAARERLSAIDGALDRPAALEEHAPRAQAIPAVPADIGASDCATVVAELAGLPEADAGVRPSVAAHLAACVECQAARAHLSTIERALDDPAALHATPAGLAGTIVGRVHLERHARPAPLRAWLAAAAVMLATLIGGWTYVGPATPPTGNPLAVLAAVDRQAVQQRLADVGRLEGVGALVTVEPGALQPSRLASELRNASWVSTLPRGLQAFVSREPAWSLALALLVALIGCNAALLRMGRRA